MAANELVRLAPLLATYLVHSTLWLGGCGAVLWLARVRHPAIRHAVWKWSAIAGFATAIAQCSLPVGSHSLEWNLLTRSDQATPIEPATVSSEVGLPADESNRMGRGRPVLPPATMALAAGETDETIVEREHRLESPTRMAPPLKKQISRIAVAAHRPSGWLFGLVLFWAVGVAVLLARVMLAWRRLCRLGHLTELTAGKERELLDRLLAATKMRRRIRLFRSPSGVSPMAWGFWSWRIVVGSALLEKLDRRELRALLAHELAHLARGDTRWLCAWSVLGAAGFLQPLNRIAHRQIRRAAELLSDSWAVAATGDRLSLARAITKAAELRGGLAPALVSPAVTSPSALSERVNRLIGSDVRLVGDTPLPRRLMFVAALVAISAAAAWLPRVTLPSAGKAADRAPSPWFETPAPATDSLRALDGEFDLLDAELDGLESLVARQGGSGIAAVGDAWRAIERRRDRLREGRARLGRLVEQATADESAPAANP